jgi:hypothetical protein
VFVPDRNRDHDKAKEEDNERANQTRDRIAQEINRDPGGNGSDPPDAPRYVPRLGLFAKRRERDDVDVDVAI